MRCAQCGKFIKGDTFYDSKQHTKDCPQQVSMKKQKRPRCLNCNKPMVEVYDSIAKKKTGHSWRCSCMPKNMVISIG